MSEEKEIGTVFDYFTKIGVAAIRLSDRLKAGVTVHFKGATTDFRQEVESMQSENQAIEEAKPGDSVGIRVKERVRKNDRVFLAAE